MEQAGVEASAGSQTERLISWLTLAFGVAGAVAAAFLHNLLWAAGLTIGAVLAWLNFRWLRRALDSLVTASTAQANSKKAQVPLRSYFLALLRYALIGLTIYVIFEYLHVPLASMVVGLCALGAAAITASVYEIWHAVE